MGWERRGNGTYYYTAHREGGRVVKEYVPAPVAEFAALIDQDRRDLRAADADALRRAKADLDALESALDPLDELADALHAAAMLAAGYHRPKRGPWRKRRA